MRPQNHKINCLKDDNKLVRLNNLTTLYKDLKNAPSEAIAETFYRKKLCVHLATLLSDQSEKCRERSIEVISYMTEKTGLRDES